MRFSHRTAGRWPGRVEALVVVGSLATWGCGCGPPPADDGRAATSPPWFEEVAGASGVDFTHRSGHANRHYMPEIMGGGAALLDVDGDGDLDVYLVQGGSLLEPGGESGRNRLYRNLGGFQFEDVTSESGAGDAGYGMGVTCGDYDGDGDVDIYVTNYGPNALLRNDGGRFTDVTSEAGVGHPGWGTSAAFVDYDGDGDLDLFVANYLDWTPEGEIDCFTFPGQPDYCNPAAYRAPARDVLYRNEGDGTFTDVSGPAGLDAAFGTGLGVATGDFDGDGRTDIFVANDGMMDQLWWNAGGGRFRDRGLLLGVAVDEEGRAKAGMGVMAEDYDGDGDLDVFVGNLEQETDSLFRNEGSYFQDATSEAGLTTASRPFTRFGLGWEDFDNDGLLDLYLADGRVRFQERSWTDDPYAEPNQLFRGRAHDGLEEVPRGGTREPLIGSSRAAAFGDLDDDGGVDVLIVNRDARVSLLRNVVPHRGHWIAFRVLDERGSDAIGSSVELEVRGTRVRREVRVAYSYLASNDPRVHFGLGDAASVRNVRVRRAGHGSRSFGDFGANRVVTLRWTDGVAEATDSEPAPPPGGRKH